MYLSILRIKFKSNSGEPQLGAKYLRTIRRPIVSLLHSQITHMVDNVIAILPLILQLSTVLLKPEHKANILSATSR